MRLRRAWVRAPAIQQLQIEQRERNDQLVVATT